jgi:ATP-binding protein involved in chromosome partitioning
VQKAVLVLSGKGGVGKTLISTNLALGLVDADIKTGLLDADFSASNSGFFLDVEGKQVQTELESFHPVTYDGLELFSIPLLYGEHSVSMSGDQYSQLLRDAIKETTWTCDYLVVDCPAGFGDELRTAARVLQDVLVGSAIVMNPAHVLDARRSINLHIDLGMPILGLIENMSYIKVGAVKQEIYGPSMIDSLCEEYNIPNFGKIPLSMKIRESVEKKEPRLPSEFIEPIKHAVDSVILAKPSTPGFLARIKELLSEQLDTWMIEFAIAANRDIEIGDVQQKFGYPGNRVIRLSVINERTGSIITYCDWIIANGKLMAASGNYRVEMEIQITPNALKWVFLKNQQTADGRIYSLQDALRLGHMKAYGPKSMVQGAHFMNHVFEELSADQKAMSSLRPILEKI